MELLWRPARKELRVSVSMGQPASSTARTSSRSLVGVALNKARI